MMMKIDKLKPGVDNHLLLFLAGIVWIGVGIMLLYLAFSWLSVGTQSNSYWFGGIGVAIALVVHHFGFLKIVDKNLNRILLMKDKQCLFAFIPWKSYLIIAIMVSMGAFLRHSSIPKQYLAILYSGIGLALILSSVRYMRVFLKQIRKS